MADTAAPPARGLVRRLARLSPAAGRTRGEWVVDGVLCVLAALYWWMTALPGVYDHLPGWWLPWDLALGAAGVALLWWSRRFPVGVGIAMILPGSLSISATVALFVAVYRMGLLARPRTAVLVAVIHVLTALPYHVILPLPGMDWLTWLVVIPLIYALCLCVGLLGRNRRQALVNLREAAARDRERFEERLATIRRDERERIAREMHDVLAHRISLLSMHAGALEFRAASEAPLDPAELGAAARVIREAAHGAVEDLRELLGLLRSDDELATGAPQPRLDDLARLVAEAEAAGQRVDFVSDARADGIRDATQRTAFRIVQEGLTNARKHAPASPVSVQLRLEGDRLGVVVRNPLPPGIAAAERTGVGNGLVGLEERVRLDGGTFEHEVVDGEFRLVAALPTGGR